MPLAVPYDWRGLKVFAKGHMGDDDLAAALAEVDEQREAVGAELRAVEERAAAAERMQAIRGSLAASYNPINSEWETDPDAVQPGQFLTLGASPEEIRRTYRRYGARFEVDKEGTLKLDLALGNPGESLHLGISSCCTHGAFRGCGHERAGPTRRGVFGRPGLC